MPQKSRPRCPPPRRLLPVPPKSRPRCPPPRRLLPVPPPHPGSTLRDVLSSVSQSSHYHCCQCIDRVCLMIWRKILAPVHIVCVGFRGSNNKQERYSKQESVPPA